MITLLQNSYNHSRFGVFVLNDERKNIYGRANNSNQNPLNLVHFINYMTAKTECQLSESILKIEEDF